jgi:Domain of unknown function (DUF4150)/GHH signature containing HNH/Endo VII superfamily nuclease toxin  2
MSNEVYANNMEISCKQAAGKTICSFPDVCFTPPLTPATPPGVPIPYPNTGIASDCTDGSSTVKISGQEVMLKDKSYFKKSTGDEAGSAPKKGLANSKNMGKVYFTAWSMDVKVEGENVVRHFDITTGNHASPLANAAIPWPHIDALTMKKGGGDCKEDVAKEKKACEEYEPYKKGGKDVCAEIGLGGTFTENKGVMSDKAKKASADPCSAARRCRLVPFNAKPQDGINGCCPAQTGDHIVPKSSFFEKSVADGKAMKGWENYNIDKAPCMCLEGGSNSGSHGLRHAHHKSTAGISKGTPRSFDAEMKHCAAGAKAVAPGCDQKCIEAQLEEGHKGMGDPKKPVKYSPTGGNFVGKVQDLLKKISDMLPKAGRQAR